MGAIAIPKAVEEAAGPAKPKLGLRAWMERVLVECDRTAAGFDVEAVHDLRVSLRRCRSLADGLIAMDPDPSWKEMKKAGKLLFQALGELRDMQVMAEWIEKLSFAQDGAGDPVAAKLMSYVREREEACKREAWKDLEEFDRKQWRQWSRELPRRAARVRLGSAVYQHLALEKWTAAYDLHKHALRTRSRVALHSLRIGIKRFRYTVENFLPRQHAAWGADLKELQDLLGDVHDLDVLWEIALKIAAFPDAESCIRWRAKINEEREKRVQRYRQLMVGKGSLWQLWRRELPQGPQLRSAATSRLRLWAGYLDPDFAHSQRVEKIALLLFDGLRGAGLLKEEREASAAGGEKLDARDALRLAAVMHDVGRSKGRENHEKKSFRMIRRMPRPLGVSAQELELAAAVARYHRGTLPHLHARALQALEVPVRRLAIELAGILRLARALDGHASAGLQGPSVKVEREGDYVLLRVAGYRAMERSGERIAAARHLLEVILKRPILVRALRNERGSRAA